MREYGSEHPGIALPDGYFESFNDYERKVLYVRCGREALLFVALQIKDAIDNEYSENSEIVILFPAYCCWSMRAPFEKMGYKVVYYRLNEDLTVNLEYLRQQLKIFNPQAVLTMNYYGSSNTKEAVALIKSFNDEIQVIEDFSHCTFCLKNIFDENVDYYISSIRKSVGVCDGAVILSKLTPKLLFISNEISDFTDKRFEAQFNKRRYTWGKSYVKKKEFLTTIRKCEELIDGFNAVHPISERAMKMLAMLNGQEIAYARRENMRHLWTRLHEVEVEIGCESPWRFRIVPGVERSFSKDGSAPFSLPILVDNRDNFQNALATRGLYTQWLWPLCDEATSVCPVSKVMNSKILSVPIDQRFNFDDIEDIANIIFNVVMSA